MTLPRRRETDALVDNSQFPPWALPLLDRVELKVSSVADRMSAEHHSLRKEIERLHLQTDDAVNKGFQALRSELQTVREQTSNHAIRLTSIEVARSYEDKGASGRRVIGVAALSSLLGATLGQILHWMLYGKG